MQLNIKPIFKEKQKTKTPSPHSFTGEFINVGRNSTQTVPEHKYIGNIILSDHH